MPKKIVYEENPWDDVASHEDRDFKEVNGLLPLPQELRKAKVVIDGSEVIIVQLSTKDITMLQNIADRDGIAYTDLAASVLHDFVESKNI